MYLGPLKAEVGLGMRLGQCCPHMCKALCLISTTREVEILIHAYNPSMQVTEVQGKPWLLIM